MDVFRNLMAGWDDTTKAAFVYGLFALPVIAAIVIFFAERVRLGPLAIELRKTTRDLDALSVAMAESRIAELEITARQFVTTLNEADKRELRTQIDKLKGVLATLRKD